MGIQPRPSKDILYNLADNNQRAIPGLSDLSSWASARQVALRRSRRVTSLARKLAWEMEFEAAEVARAEFHTVRYGVWFGSGFTELPTHELTAAHEAECFADQEAYESQFDSPEETLASEIAFEAYDEGVRVRISDAEERLLRRDQEKLAEAAAGTTAAIKSVIAELDGDEQISKADIETGFLLQPVPSLQRLQHIALSARLLPRPFKSRRSAG